VNPVSQELTAQLGFRYAGDFAQDSVTPKVNMKLLVNNVSGRQEFDFPKGERMSRIEVTFPLDGDVNRYPFDRYTSELRFLMTTPGRTKPQRPPEGSKDASREALRPEETALPGALEVGEAALQGSVPVPLSISLLASVQGVKFSGAVSRQADSDLTGIDLVMRRPDNLIVVSFFVMFLMISLAVSVLTMALKVTNMGKKSDLLPLSLSLSLIFGLPALRGIQPGVPPVGALADYFSFIWAESFVAASAIIVMWTWLKHSEST
jgi:hypothetical protein